MRQFELQKINVTRKIIYAKFGFTEAQAEAIVSLQLYRLTNTDITALQEEADELNKKIIELQAILQSEKDYFK